MAKVMLVDAAFSAEPIYRGIKQQGHSVLTVGARRSDPLVTIGGNHRTVDYSDAKAIQQVAREEQIDFIVPGCTDVSYASSLSLNTDGQLPGLDTPEAHATLHNKRQFRQFLAQHGLSAPKTFDQPYPQNAPSLIIKPVDSFSGKGITHLTNPSNETIEGAYQKACNHSESGQAVVEEFVDGQLYSHSAFIENGKILNDYIVEEHCAASPFAVDISHIDHELPPSIIDSLRREIEYIARTLQLKNGLIHTQFICDKKQYWLIEITRRCPGDLYSQLIELSGFTTYINNYIAGFLGSTLTSEQNTEHTYILRQTLKAQDSQPFFWLNLCRSAPVKTIIPLAQPGQPMKADERQAIVFYECQNQTHLQEIKSELLNTIKNN